MTGWAEESMREAIDLLARAGRNDLATDLNRIQARVDFDDLDVLRCVGTDRIADSILEAESFSELIALLETRFGYMRAAARIKPERGMVRDEARKAQVIAQAKTAAFDAGVPVGLVADFWERLVEASIAYEGEQWELLRR